MAQIAVTLEQVQHRDQRKHIFKTPSSTTIGVGDSYTLTANGTGSTILDTMSDTEYTVSESVSTVAARIASSAFSKPFSLEVARGSVSGFSGLNKFGSNPDIDAATAPEDVWDVGGLYTFPTSGDASHIWAAIDSVATQGMTIEVQGLGVDYSLVVQEKSLDGSNSTTVVALDTPLTRVFRMKVKGSVDADQNIICGNAGKSATYAQMASPNNQTLMAIYTIPLGKTGFLEIAYASLVKAGAANATAQWSLSTREFGGVFQVKHWGGVAAEGNTRAEHEFSPHLVLQAKTDIIVTAESVTENNSAFTAGFNIYLEDD